MGGCLSKGKEKEGASKEKILDDDGPDRVEGVDNNCATATVESIKLEASDERAVDVAAANKTATGRKPPAQSQGGEITPEENGIGSKRDETATKSPEKDGKPEGEIDKTGTTNSVGRDSTVQPQKNGDVHRSEKSGSKEVESTTTAVASGGTSGKATEEGSAAIIGASSHIPEVSPDQSLEHGGEAKADDSSTAPEIGEESAESTEKSSGTGAAAPGVSLESEEETSSLLPIKIVDIIKQEERPAEAARNSQTPEDGGSMVTKGPSSVHVEKEERESFAQLPEVDEGITDETAEGAVAGEISAAQPNRVDGEPTTDIATAGTTGMETPVYLSDDSCISADEPATINGEGVAYQPIENGNQHLEDGDPLINLEEPPVHPGSGGVKALLINGTGEEPQAHENNGIIEE